MHRFWFASNLVSTPWKRDSRNQKISKRRTQWAKQKMWKRLQTEMRIVTLWHFIYYTQKEEQSKRPWLQKTKPQLPTFSQTYLPKETAKTQANSSGPRSSPGESLPWEGPNWRTQCHSSHPEELTQRRRRTRWKAPRWGHRSWAPPWGSRRMGRTRARRRAGRRPRPPSGSSSCWSLLPVLRLGLSRPLLRHLRRPRLPHRCHILRLVSSLSFWLSSERAQSPSGSSRSRVIVGRHGSDFLLRAAFRRNLGIDMFVCPSLVVCPGGW